MPNFNDENHVDPAFIEEFVSKTPLVELLAMNLDKMGLDEESYNGYKTAIAAKQEREGVPENPSITGRIKHNEPPPFQFPNFNAFGQTIVDAFPPRVRHLMKGIELTSGDRNKTHGDFKQGMEAYAAYLNVYLSQVLGVPVNLKGSHAAMVLHLVKLARAEVGSFNPDDAIDGSVYFTGWAECREAEQNEPN